MVNKLVSVECGGGGGSVSMWRFQIEVGLVAV